MLSTIRPSLTQVFAPEIIDELFSAYVEAKRNFYLGGLRLSAVEGGRFCEAAFRMLEQETTGRYTPLGRQMDSQKLVSDLSNLPVGSKPDSVRLHIPRALRVVYDIRSKRDAVHLADGIDPNLQDAILVIAILDWVLAEFIRIHHHVAADEAQAMIEEIVIRSVPAVQDFDGFLKVLNPNLRAGDHLLLLLYERGNAGATFEQLNGWARPEMRANLRATLARLVDVRLFAHFDGQKYTITGAGQRYVEVRKLVDFQLHV